MAKEKNAGSYARGAAPRRSADRKADHVLRLNFLKRELEGIYHDVSEMRKRNEKRLSVQQ